MNELTRIQYISSGKSLTEQEKNIKTALDAGVTWVQLRWKNFSSYKELLKLASLTKDLCKSYSATYIINDHIDLAKDLDSDGVHLGLKDEPIFHARLALGTEKIIGGTANSYPDILQRNREGCNYIGLGPCRFTKSKENLSPILGLEGYHSLTSILREDRIKSVPIFAIGGVTKNDIPALIEADIYGVAISSSINNQPNSISIMKKYYEEYTQNSR